MSLFFLIILKFCFLHSLHTKVKCYTNPSGGITRDICAYKITYKKIACAWNEDQIEKREMSN